MPLGNKDYYKILQVDPSADPEVVEAAYKRLARKYHPDMNTSPDATLRMQELNAAYRILHNPAKRAQYDRERASQSPRPDSKYEEERRQREESDAVQRQAEAARRHAEEEQRKREEAEATQRRAKEDRQRREQARAEWRRAEEERWKREEAEILQRHANFKQVKPWVKRLIALGVGLLSTIGFVYVALALWDEKTAMALTSPIAIALAILISRLKEIWPD